MGIATPGGVSLWLGTVARARGVRARATSPASRTRARSARRSWPAGRASASARSSRPAASSRATSPTSSPSWPTTRARGRSACSSRRSGARTPSPPRWRCAAEAGKPVVCLKVGRSQAAARAALAHSGAVVGSARAFSALLRHHGALEVGDFHELLETLEVLGRRRWPRGLRIAGVSESGGECGLLADHGEEAGHPVRAVRRRAQGRLVEAFPNFTLPENPLDCWAIDAYEHVFPGTPRAAARDRRLRRAAGAARPLAPPRRARGGVVRVRSSRRSPTPSRARTSSRP